MQLNPGERSLLAYFTDYSAAKQAVSALETAGFSDMEISPLQLNPAKFIPNHTISSLVYGHSGYDKSYGPLLAADPLVSGLSSQYAFSPAYNYILIMFIDNHNYQVAVDIIRENGGLI